MDADQLVARHILAQYRDRHQRYWFHSDDDEPHLAHCSDVAVAPLAGEDGLAEDGFYGCEYVRFHPVFTCAHGVSEEFEWGTFGELADIIAALEEDAGRG